MKRTEKNTITPKSLWSKHQKDPIILASLPYFSLTLEMVTKIFKVSKSNIICRSRANQNISGARQVAMYMMHICFGLNLTQTGKLFGRDRTTVAYACKVVEDRRDKDGYDIKLAIIEQTLKQLRKSAVRAGS